MLYSASHWMDGRMTFTSSCTSSHHPQPLQQVRYDGIPTPSTGCALMIRQLLFLMVALAAAVPYIVAAARAKGAANKWRRVVAALWAGYSTHGHGTVHRVIFVQSGLTGRWSNRFSDMSPKYSQRAAHITATLPYGWHLLACHRAGKAVSMLGYRTRGCAIPACMPARVARSLWPHLRYLFEARCAPLLWRRVRLAGARLYWGRRIVRCAAPSVAPLDLYRTTTPHRPHSRTDISSFPRFRVVRRRPVVHACLWGMRGRAEHHYSTEVPRFRHSPQTIAFLWRTGPDCNDHSTSYTSFYLAHWPVSRFPTLSLNLYSATHTVQRTYNRCVGTTQWRGLNCFSASTAQLSSVRVREK